MKDYHRMAEADIFEPGDRVELIYGEGFELAPMRAGDSVAPLAFPDVVLEVAVILG